MRLFKTMKIDTVGITIAIVLFSLIYTTLSIGGAVYQAIVH